MAELTRELTSELNAEDVGSAPTVPAHVPSTETSIKTTRAMRLWQIVFVVILVLFAGVLALRLWDTNTTEQRANGIAPDFTFTTYEGQTIRLADLRGKGVVVNFWASWCDPCRDEAALLQAAAQREEENGIVFLGLDYFDQEPAAKAYLAEYGITYPNGPDIQSQAARRYGIKGVPETYFVSPEGEIVQAVIGPVTSAAQLDGYLAKIRP
jgi:cytochrome c biogenesis protein CcmG/thiol:disulfide interchange protein DsbE